MGRLFHKRAHADSNQSAFTICGDLLRSDFVQPDHIHDHFHAFGIIAAVEMLFRDRHKGKLFLLHHAHSADVMRLNADVAGERIDRHFHRITHAGPGNAAIRHQRRLVGRHGLGTAPVDFNVVRPRQIAMGHRAFEAIGKWIDRIRAGIDGHIAVEPKDTAFRCRVNGDEIMMFSAVRTSHEMFTPVFDPAHRHLKMTGQPAGDHLFRLEQRLAAEPAANVGRDNADLALFETEKLRQPRADKMRHLGRRPHHQLIGAIIPFSEYGAAFHRVHRMAGHAVFPFDNHGRPVCDLAEIVIREGFHHKVVTPVLVDKRCVAGFRREHIDNRRQFLELDQGRLREILRFRPCIGDADGDRFANEPDLADCQRRVIGPLVPGHLGRCAHRLHVGHVRRREDGRFKTGRLGD